MPSLLSSEYCAVGTKPAVFTILPSSLINAGHGPVNATGAAASESA